MGAYVSISECRTHYNKTVDCNFTFTEGNKSIGSYKKGAVPPDPDVAGVGVCPYRAIRDCCPQTKGRLKIVYVFIGVTAFALVLSIADVAWLVVKMCGQKQRDTAEETEDRHGRRRCSGLSGSQICETLVLSCSDQQVFTGGAYALTLRYWKGCDITAYHYNIVANMMLLTCATHLMSVTIVRNYWRYPWLGLLRLIAISGLFLVTGILLSNQNADKDKMFPTTLPDLNTTDSILLLPAACFQSESTLLPKTLKASFEDGNAKNAFFDSTPGNHIQGWQFYLIILLWYVAAFIVDVVRFFRRGMNRTNRDGSKGRRATVVAWVNKKFMPRGQWGTIPRRLAETLFVLYLFGGIGVSAATVIKTGQYMTSLRTWVKNSQWLQAEEGGAGAEDDATSFGQLVPIFLCLLTLFTFAQTISEMSSRYSETKYSQAGDVTYDPSYRYTSQTLLPEKPSPLFSEAPVTPGTPGSMPLMQHYASAPVTPGSMTVILNHGGTDVESHTLQPQGYASSTGATVWQGATGGSRVNSGRYSSVPVSSTTSGSPKPQQSPLSEINYFPSQSPPLQRGSNPSFQSFSRPR